MRRKKSNIIVLTGASGVGKTTLVDYLESSLSSELYAFYRFDDIGIPSEEYMIEKYESTSLWQKNMTEEWIDKLVHLPMEKCIIFEGQMHLDYIIEAFAKHDFVTYDIFLLDCNKQEMSRRLIEERNQPELVTEDMYNWLSYLRNLAKEKGIPIIDTSDKTVMEVAARFTKSNVI